MCLDIMILLGLTHQELQNYDTTARHRKQTELTKDNKKPKSKMRTQKQEKQVFISSKAKKPKS